MNGRGGVACAVVGATLGLLSFPAFAEQTTITYMSRWVGGVRQTIIDQFEQLHPDIKVQMIEVPGGNPGDIMAKFIATSAAGEAPDVVGLMVDQLVPMAARGMLVNLNGYAAADKYDLKGQFIPGALDLVTYRGGTWALPITQDTRLLMYNREHFVNAGLDPNKAPGTWDAFAAAARKLTLPGSSAGTFKRFGYVEQSDFIEYLWNFGGQPVSSDGRTALLNSTEAHDAMDYVVNLDVETGAARGTLTPPPNDDVFKGGRGSMTIYGSWEVQHVVEDYPDFELGIAPIPTLAAGIPSQTTGGGTFLSISSHSKHPKEAWEFIQFFASHDMAALFGGGTQLPARFDVAKDFGRGNANARFLTFAPKLLEIAQNQIHFNHPAETDIMQIMNKAKDAATKGTVSIVQALANAQTEATAAIARVKDSL